jgi:O-antigen/teichoic acid export membrane protein
MQSRHAEDSPLDGDAVVAGPARRHLGAGAFASLVVQVAPLVGVTLLSVVVARHLGPDATGVVALMTTLLEVVLALAGFGLTVGITYLVSRGDWSARDAFRESQLAGLLLGALGVAVGLAVFLITRDKLFAGISLVSALLGIGHLPLSLSRGFTGAIALARERYEAYAAFELAGTIVLIAAAVPLTLAIGVNGALLGILLAHVASFAAAAVWGVRYSRVAPVPAHAHPRRLKEAITFGSKAWGASLLQLINYRLDLFLVSAFVTRADVGRYSVALSVTALAWILPAALETVIFPRTADLHAAQGRGEIALEESDQATTRAIRHSVVLLVPATVIVLLLVVVAIPLLYGSAFSKSVWFGLILIPGVVALSLGKSLSAVITGRGKPQYALWTTAVTVPLSIVLYFTLIPVLGGYGAALGSTLSYFTSTALALLWFRRTTHIPLRTAVVPSGAELRDYRDALLNVRQRLRPRAT